MVLVKWPSPKCSLATKCIPLHSRRRIPTSALEVQLNGHTIDGVQRYRFLGVTITDTLCWSDHIDQECSRASRGLILLQRLVRFLPRSALVCYYNAYVLPHLMYAAPVWSSCTKAQSTKLEGLQNVAACIVLRCHGYASATSMQTELGWPTLSSRSILGDSDLALMPIRPCPWLPFHTPQAHLLCAQPHGQIYSQQRYSSPTCLHRVLLCLPGRRPTGRIPYHPTWGTRPIPPPSCLLPGCACCLTNSNNYCQPFFNFVIYMPTSINTWLNHTWSLTFPHLYNT